MAGYWQTSLLRLSPSKRKTERGQYSAILIKQALSIKDLASQRTKTWTFFAGPTREIPSRQLRWAHLACSDSQSEGRIRFILFGHTIKENIFK